MNQWVRRLISVPQDARVKRSQPTALASVTNPHDTVGCTYTFVASSAVRSFIRRRRSALAGSPAACPPGAVGLRPLLTAAGVGGARRPMATASASARCRPASSRLISPSAYCQYPDRCELAIVAGAGDGVKRSQRSASLQSHVPSVHL